MSSLKELQAIGGFIADKPVLKTIKFQTPDEAGELVDRVYDVFVKRLSVGDYEALFLTDKEEKSRTAKLISETIMLGKDGSERISFQQAYKLHPSLAAAMVEAFNEVNSAKKPSRPATGSSAS